MADPVSDLLYNTSPELDRPRMEARDIIAPTPCVADEIYAPDYVFQCLRDVERGIKYEEDFTAEANMYLNGPESVQDYCFTDPARADVPADDDLVMAQLALQNYGAP